MSAAAKREPQSKDIPPAELPELENLVGFLLRVASNTADAYFSRQMSDTDVTPRQYAVLLILCRHAQLTQTEVASITKIDRSTTNEMIPRLVTRGLVVRHQSKTDRRAMTLSISSAGRDVVRRATIAAQASHQSIMNALPLEYRKIFKHCLEVIIQANATNLPTD
ncbi:MAG: MarR family transcriptional regulator [Ramlibacter sp.]|nr:MarR family transcriptional regulator [Ramlibacter sp.]